MAKENSTSVPSGRFPSTRRSAVLLVGSDDPVERARSFDLLVRAYWKPVYKYVRVRHNKRREVACDVTQGFFARAFEKRYFANYDRGQARFRTFIKMCLDRYVMEERRTQMRLKRGGDSVRVSLDFDAAEAELNQIGTATTEDIDAYFEREWMRALLGAAVDDLRERCHGDDKAAYFETFERYVLQPAALRPTYDQLATEIGIKTSDVTNYLAWTRRTFRTIVLDQLREITASEEEFRAEARLLLGDDDP